MLQHVQNAVSPLGFATLAQVAGMPWWAQLITALAGMVLPLLFKRKQ